MARPKKYEQGAERITMSLSPETKSAVEAFCRWYSFTRDKTLGIGETLIEVLMDSEAFAEFTRTRPAIVTRPGPAAQLALFDAPAPLPGAPSQDSPDEVAVLEMVRKRMAVESVRVIAKGAGVDATSLYKSLKGERHLTTAARQKLTAHLKR